MLLLASLPSATALLKVKIIHYYWYTFINQAIAYGTI